MTVSTSLKNSSQETLNLHILDGNMTLIQQDSMRILEKIKAGQRSGNHQHAWHTGSQALILWSTGHRGSHAFFHSRLQGPFQRDNGKLCRTIRVTSYDLRIWGSSIDLTLNVSSKESKREPAQAPGLLSHRPCVLTKPARTGSRIQSKSPVLSWL